MIKYSLIAIAAAAVLFTVGCEDSDCCGVGNAPKAVITNGGASGQELKSSHTKSKPLVVDSYVLSSANSRDTDDVGTSSNGIKTHSWTIDGQPATDGAQVPADGKAHEVCLTVVDDEGKSDKTCGWVKVGTETVSTKPVARFSLPTTCTPGEVINLNADSSSDSDGNVASYQWSKGATATTSATTATCPASGSLEVCLVVTDNDGQASSMVCKTTSVAVGSCNPHITVKDTSGNEVTTVIAGQEYKFENNVVAADCPNVECTWSVRSHRTDNSGWFTCLIDNSHTGTNDEPPVRPDGQYHVNLDGAGNTAKISVQTCASVYNYFEVTLNCTNPNVHETKDYNLTTTP